MYDKLFARFNDIDNGIQSTSGLINKIQYNMYKQGLEKKIQDVDEKIPYTSVLFKTTDYNTKVTKIENKIDT